MLMEADLKNALVIFSPMKILEQSFLAFAGVVVVRIL